MKAAKWNKIVLGTSMGILLAVAGVTVVIDPFWHFHKPLEGLQYPLNDSRYQNDGIARHSDYDAVITGTSMTQNFKTSEFDALWDAKAVKITFSGASYREIAENIDRAASYNPKLKYVVRSLDGNRLIAPADEYSYEGYPEYLYDGNPFNDVNYCLNKEVVPKTLAVINYTRAGNRTPTMDEYESWNAYKTFGREEVRRTLPQWGEFEESVLSETDRENVIANVRENVLRTALEHPRITFYVFFPPYSICYWEALVRTKQLHAQLEAEQMATEILLGADNIRVFAFGGNTEMIADLDNYTDSLHYGEWVNSDILRWMNAGEYELTKENYREYYQKILAIYEGYDYESVWQP